MVEIATHRRGRRRHVMDGAPAQPIASDSATACGIGADRAVHRIVAILEPGVDERVRWIIVASFRGKVGGRACILA